MAKLEDVIPYYQCDRFVEQLAFSLWSYDVWRGHRPTGHVGSWKVNKNEYLAQARYVAEDLDRTAAA